MPRIAGVDVPNHKRGEIALTSIFGIGRSLAKEILQRVGIDYNLHPSKWSEEETRQVRRLIEDEYQVEGQLANRAPAEHQAIDGYWLLSRVASSQRTSIAWATH